MRRFLLVIGCFCLVSSMVEAQTVYLKPAEALKQIFHDSQEVAVDKKSLTQDQKECVQKKLGAKLQKSDWTFQIAKTNGNIDGYALIDSEPGKTEPITFMTAITPQGDVKEVEVLVYREPYGSEVHEPKYLKQYRGKKAEDPLRVGQDISNMSGATISSRSIALGVKRALSLWSCVYGK